MVAAVQKAGSSALLVGMRLPPNYGPAYVRRFSGTFEEAPANARPPSPFLFEGFAEDDTMFQGDRIHPVCCAAEAADNVVARPRRLAPPGRSR
jgi:acyl-CoA thioesterase-1